MPKIPLKTYRDKLIGVFKDTFRYIKEAQIPLIASSLAYTTILSIVPLLAVSFAIFQAFGGLEKIYAMLEPIIIENLAQGQGEQTAKTIKEFITKIHAGAMGVGGLVGLIVTSMSMLSSAEKAINKIWNTEIRRNFFQRISAYWLFITLGPLTLAVVMGLINSSPKIETFKFFPGGTAFFISSALFFSAVYKWVPNRHVQWKPAIIAAIMTAGLWSLARFGYSIYTKSFVSYQKIYGSLAAIPIFILWIYILWMIILSGAAISAALQKRFENSNA